MFLVSSPSLQLILVPHNSLQFSLCMSFSTYRWLLENQRKFSYDVSIKNVTDDLACLGVAGPRSRDVLSKMTSSDLSDGSFPYLAFQKIEMSGLPIQASRFSSTGRMYIKCFFFVLFFSVFIYNMSVGTGRVW